MLKSRVVSLPSKRAPEQRFRQEFVCLVILHISIEFLRVHDNILTAHIKAPITTITLSTVYEGTFNNKYVWMQVRHIHTDILVPTGIMQTENTHNMS